MKFVKSIYLNLFLFLLSAKSALAANEVPEPGGYARLSDLTIVFANVVSVASAFAGFALLIVIIRGGIAYMTAQGDPKALMSARGTLTWGIIGFIVILAAYLIISVIVGFVSVPGIGRFCIPKAGTDISTFCQIN